MIVEIALVLAFYLTWNIGVQTMGALLGITIGGGTLGLRKGIIIGGTFSILGALLLSNRIAATIGTGLINFDMTGVIAVMLCAAIIATLLAWKRIPISLSYLIIGGIAGYSFGAGVSFNIGLYSEVLLGLFLAPVIAIVLGYVIYYIIRKFVRDNIKGVKGIEVFESKFQLPNIFSLAFISFAVGVDSIGVVIGVLGKSFSYLTLGTIGALGMFFGMLIWGHRIARTVGIELTDLSPTRSFSAEVAAGIVAMMFLVFSIPVSISQTLIGAIVGIGLARGRIEGGTVKDILIYWGVALPSAFILAFAFGVLI